MQILSNSQFQYTSFRCIEIDILLKKIASFIWLRYSFKHFLSQLIMNKDSLHGGASSNITKAIQTRDIYKVVYTIIVIHNKS